MSKTLAAAIGGAAGALAFMALLIFLLWFCRFLCRNLSRTSETTSSSIQTMRNVTTELSLREAGRFELDELTQATNGFTSKSLIGEGKFGEVYKGLLQDGMLVAIKKRPGSPTQEFINEIRYQSSIHHRNIVTLLGYCQENNMQFLVYEYIHNGSVSSHLYGDGGKGPGQKLEFRHRLMISLGAAKDENFTAKIADSGLCTLLDTEDAGSSSRMVADEILLAPEVQEFRRFSDKSDVYAFGVFLLELVTGREASEPSPSCSDQTLLEWMRNNVDYTDLSVAVIDERLGSSYTEEGMEELIRLTAPCLEVSSERRPEMSYVVTELKRILDREVSLTTLMGEEGTPTVTLGSQLFKAIQ
ncbi:PREDICTED: proline-rich receptor-like protein kinase PERK12 isoform X3 [Tarenaya hassleriana]|uniref:proline-rich receptor-like protein kinase PERK12 isoform X3 n=1 Tax=Tarenaya hassleriana TaxID=28532 RepID=UPI00053CA393|nr:PREDICTED: proline-rich receptor-like protein kinase PERK12 isoform X3 [Tarenaya hassleriana]